MADQLLAHTWCARPEAGYPAALQTVVNNLALKYLLQLAADNRAAASVRGQAMLAVEGLQKWMQAEAKRAQPAQKANLLFGLSEINRFKDDPSKLTPPPAVNMPPGAPIDMGAIDFLN